MVRGHFINGQQSFVYFIFSVFFTQLPLTLLWKKELNLFIFQFAKLYKVQPAA